MATSAGVIMFRRTATSFEVLLGHMGGPFWASKDRGTWSIPKGEVADGEDPFSTATREFEEEMGVAAPSGDFHDLGSFEQSKQKTIHIWAVEGDCDVSACSSNLFEMEWPPRSGHVQSFPEIDRAEWFDTVSAKDRVIRGQIQVIERLEELLTTVGTNGD